MRFWLGLALSIFLQIRITFELEIDEILTWAGPEHFPLNVSARGCRTRLTAWAIKSRLVFTGRYVHANILPGCLARRRSAPPRSALYGSLDICLPILINSNWTSMRWGLELAVSSFIWILIILAWAGLDLELLSRNEFYGTAWFFFMGNCDYALKALSLDIHNFEIDKTVGCSWALILC